MRALPSSLQLCLLLPLAAALPACGGDGGRPDRPIPKCADGDGDGYGVGSGCMGSDCDDEDAERHDGCPQERCDDADGDGYGEGPGCRGPDCLDADPASHVDAPEICGDGLDNDCAGGDEACIPGCEDEDGDGYGEGADCRGPDCNDSDPAVHPGADEICENGKDDDCLGNGDAACPEKCDDRDLDGYGVGPDCMGRDCNDRNPRVFEGAAEICDYLDNDCDNLMDECPAEDQLCGDDDECVVSPGGDCSGGVPCVARHDCAGGVCRGLAGAECDEDGDCIPGFACDPADRVCTDDPCAPLQCSARGMVCDSESPRCAPCLADEHCQGGGFCTENERCRGPAVPLGGSARIRMAQALVACYDGNADPGDRAVLCAYVDAGDLAESLRPEDYDTWVCDEARAADFGGGGAGEQLLERATDLAGCGGFNDSETSWDRPVPAGSRGHTCIWFKPRAFAGLDPSVNVTPCSELPEELQQ